MKFYLRDIRINEIVSAEKPLSDCVTALADINAISNDTEFLEITHYANGKVISHTEYKLENVSLNKIIETIHEANKRKLVMQYVLFHTAHLPVSCSDIEKMSYTSRINPIHNALCVELENSCYFFIS